MKFSRPVVVQCHSNLQSCPVWACMPMGQKLFKFGTTGVRTLWNTYLWTAGWICTVRNLILWNCRNLYLCSIMGLLHWPWIFKVNCWKNRITGIRGPIDTERKECESIGNGTHFVALNFDLPHDLDLECLRSNVWKSCISGTGGSIYMGQKGCESIRCLTHYLTKGPWALTLKLKFQGQILKKSYPRMGGPIGMERKGCESIGSRPHFVTLNFDLIQDVDLGS